VDPMFELDEIWKDIPGFPGYQASSEGRVRSVDRVIEQSGSHRARPYSLVRKGRILRPCKCKSGHLQVMCGRFNPRVNLHALVCLAFHGEKPSLTHEVLHLDHDPGNNRPDNLKWGTRGENLKMDYAHGVRRRWK
jgi:NUMOD4 motif/HNH endonuclease